MANKDQGLRVDLTGGLLTISIGVSQVCASIASGTVFEDFKGGEGAAITDEDAFVRAVAAKLREVREETTLVHDMLDVAARKALDEGCHGVRFPGDA